MADVPFHTLSLVVPFCSPPSVFHLSFSSDSSLGSPTLRLGTDDRGVLCKATQCRTFAAEIPSHHHPLLSRQSSPVTALRIRHAFLRSCCHQLSPRPAAFILHTAPTSQARLAYRRLIVSSLCIAAQLALSSGPVSSPESRTRLAVDSFPPSPGSALFTSGTHIKCRPAMPLCRSIAPPVNTSRSTMAAVVAPGVTGCGRPSIQSTTATA